MTIEEIRKNAPNGKRRSYGFTKEKAAIISLSTKNAYIEKYKPKPLQSPYN